MRTEINRHPVEKFDKIGLHWFRNLWLACQEVGLILLDSSLNHWEERLALLWQKLSSICRDIFSLSLSLAHSWIVRCIGTRISVIIGLILYQQTVGWRKILSNWPQTRCNFACRKLWPLGYEIVTISSKSHFNTDTVWKEREREREIDNLIWLLLVCRLLCINDWFPSCQC